MNALFIFSELFDVLNEKALQAGDDFIPAFITFSTSLQCANFEVNGRRCRNFMMSVLQKNYQNCKQFNSHYL